MTCTNDPTPAAFGEAVSNPAVGISWISDETFCCPHFVCSTCSRPIRPDAPGIVIWRYEDGEPESSIEYRIRHKTPECDRRDARSEGGHFWFWDDLDDVLDQLVFNTLGRKPPEDPRAHRAYELLPPELPGRSQPKIASKAKPAKKHGNTGAATTQTQRWRILRRDSWTCQLCGKSAAEHNAALEVDHMQPASKGGTNDDSNLWTLCAACNGGKRDELS